MIQAPLANVVVETFFHGGVIMWPLLVLSLFAIGVITERVIWRIAARRRQDTALLTRTYEALTQGDRAEAVTLAEGSGDPRLRVIAYGLQHPEAELEVAMQIRQVDELKIARRFLTAMDTIITLAPLLGLLGTVTGIMQSFKFVGGDQELAANKVSGGIGEALIATATGLGIAIITLVPFNVFGSYAEELHEELDTVIKNVRLLIEKARPSRHERNYQPAGSAE
jgi:biopolymer transport protein ExbB